MMMVMIMMMRSVLGLGSMTCPVTVVSDRSNTLVTTTIRFITTFRTFSTLPVTSSHVTYNFVSFSGKEKSARNRWPSTIDSTDLLVVVDVVSPSVFGFVHASDASIIIISV